MTLPTVSSGSRWTISLCAALLLSGVVSAQISENDPNRPRDIGQTRRRGVRQDPELPKPQDPARIRATYTIDGKSVEVTEGEFYDLFQLLKREEPQSRALLSANRVTEHILLLAEARALGCELSQAEKDRLNPLKGGHPAAIQGLKDRLKSLGISEADHVRYLSETRAIQRLKNLFANSGRVLSTEVYDTWAQQHQNYVVGYLEFPAKDEEEALRKSPPDKEALQEFYSRNSIVQNEMRRQMTVTADLLIFDSSNSDNATPAGAPEKVTRADALEYFRRNMDRLMKSISSQDRARIHSSWKKTNDLASWVTPFEVLHDQIVKEMKLRPIVDAAFADARKTGSKWDPRASARKYGLQHVLIDQGTRQDVHNEYKQLGPQFFNKLWNTTNGRVCDEISSQGSVYYFWRLRSKSISTLPTFEEALELGLLEKYYELQSDQLARKKAQAAMVLINAEVDKNAGVEMSKIDAKFDAMIEKELANITVQNRKNQIKMSLDVRRNHEKNKVRNRLRPPYFEDYAAKNGMTIHEYGPFEFKPGFPGRAKLEDPKEKKDSFVRSYWGLRGLEPGDVEGRVASDRISRRHFIFKLVDRRAPDFSSMPAVDYIRTMSNLSRSKIYSGNFRWTHGQLITRHNWIEK